MISLEFLQLLIYFVFIFAIVAYATLDGFDLGVGCLHFFAKTDEERRLMINSIGPVWDSNTTWIVIGGGVLFAGFPRVFATMMSGFYTPVMILIFCYMLRGAAVEFRGKLEGKTWRKLWDISFFFSSILLAISVGVLLGNLIQGIPLNEMGEVDTRIFQLMRPYPLMVALLGLSLFMMHGSIYLLMKTEGELHKRLRSWVKRLVALFLVSWIATTVCTFLYNKHMVRPFAAHPWLIVFPLVTIFCVGMVLRSMAKRRDGWAFIFSCFSIVFLLSLFAIGTFPYLIYSTIDPAHYSMTLFNSASSKTTLMVLMIIALTGLPLGFFYGSYLYKVFHGKIKLDSMSY